MDKFTYINRRIDNLEDELGVVAARLRTESDLIEIHKKQVELNVLKEIKTDLLAWDVIKVYFEYEDGDSALGIKQGLYQTKELPNAAYKAIKKAFNVKD